MSWLDELALSESSMRGMLNRLHAVELRDYGQRIMPGPVDTASMTLVRRTLATEGENLLLALPRGVHDFAIFCGLVIQLIRVGARASDSSSRLGFDGPVVVVGLDTQILRRLRDVTVASHHLGLTLLPLRLRSDGQITHASGSLRPPPSRWLAASDRVLYLNTRVGWPRLPEGITAGVIVIDRTSFRDERIFDRALAWAKTNGAGTTVVIADLGDKLTTERLRSLGKLSIWPWVPKLLRRASSASTGEYGDSALLTNRLLGTRRANIEVALCVAPLVEPLFTRCFARLAAARKVKAPYPRPLVAVKRLLNHLVSCVGSVEEYDQWAALDHRTSSLASLRLAIERSDTRAFHGPWRGFGETRWAELRLEALQLHDAVNQENPKLFALALLLDELHQAIEPPDVVVRVTNQAAGNALATDLLDYGFEMSQDDGPLTWAPLARRFPWAGQERIEVYPGTPAPWRRTALWTGEGTRGVFLTYQFERRWLNASLELLARETRSTLAGAFERFSLGPLPPIAWPESATVAHTFEVQESPSETLTAAVDLAFDLTALFDVDQDDHHVRRRGATDGVRIKGVPIEVEPGGEWWWVRVNDSVEVLRRGIYRELAPNKLRAGDLIIVPRGEGRDALFARIIEARHSKGDLRAFETALSRIGRAVRSVYLASGGRWSEVRRKMRDRGSSVSPQAIRRWGMGETIAPRDAEDIKRIGNLAGDEILIKQHTQIAHIAEEIRSLHRKIGRVLSAAMKEAIDGGGPNVNALADILGFADVEELLDEFHLRTVLRVDKTKEIPSHLIGTLQKKRSPE